MEFPSLKGLYMPLTKELIDERMRICDEENAKYKAKYGDDWLFQLLKDRDVPKDYDCDMKMINEGIYYGSWVSSTSCDGDRIRVIGEKQLFRMHELYGDNYDELLCHKARDSRIAELLLQDAIKTGKWKELPDELQDEYKKRVSGLNGKNEGI